MTVPEMLYEAAKIYEKRAEVYGNSYRDFGPVMMALFPQGLDINTSDDWNHLGVLMHMITKLTRYAPNFHRGHDDSLADLAVYATILRELDRESEVKAHYAALSPTLTKAKQGTWKKD